jgi:hypothetical protein
VDDGSLSKLVLCKEAGRQRLFYQLTTLCASCFPQRRLCILPVQLRHMIPQCALTDTAQQSLTKHYTPHSPHDVVVFSVTTPFRNVVGVPTFRTNTLLLYLGCGGRMFLRSVGTNFSCDATAQLGPRPPRCGF